MNEWERTGRINKRRLGDTAPTNPPKIGIIDLYQPMKLSAITAKIINHESAYKRDMVLVTLVQEAKTSLSLF